MNKIRERCVTWVPEVFHARFAVLIHKQVTTSADEETVHGWKVTSLCQRKVNTVRTFLVTIEVGGQVSPFLKEKYSRSFPCDVHSRKRCALVMISFFKPRLNCN